MAKAISRRKFAKFAGGVLGGTAMLDSMLAEAQQKGGLSRDSVKLLLELNDLGDIQLTNEELDRIKESFERTLKSIRKIRAYKLRQSVEPAAIFLARR